MLRKIYDGIKIFQIFWKIQTRKQIFLFFLVLASILIGAILETIGVSILIPFIQAILSPIELMDKPFINKITKLMHISNEKDFILFITICIICFYILKNLYTIMSEFIQNKYRCIIQEYASTTILNNYLHYPYSFFIKTNSAELLRDVISDADGLMFCIGSVFSILTQVFMSILICCLLFITDYFIAAWLALSVAFVLLFPILILSHPIRKTGTELRENAAVCYKKALQSFNGIKEIIVYGKQDYFSEEYKKTYKTKSNNDVKSCIYKSMPSRFIETVCISALALALCSERFHSGIDTTKITHLAVFAMAAFKLLPSIAIISQSFNTLISSYSVLTSVSKNMNKKTKYDNLITKKQIVNFSDCIKFENVGFTYEGTNENVFSDVNLTIHKGDIIGIVGPSGSGKTTFVDVLLGLLKNTSGTISIDGVELTENNIESWRDLIAYVPQSAYLMDDTIRANIAFGQETKRIDDAKIYQTLKESMLDEYVKKQPNEVQTVVGERGIMMSGGQKQRISIARALYTNPEIIIFDEATSALDEQTEKDVMESIDNLIGKKTLFIIAHRLSTLKKCTKILHVESGIIFQEDKLPSI